MAPQKRDTEQHPATRRPTGPVIDAAIDAAAADPAVPSDPASPTTWAASCGPRVDAVGRAGTISASAVTDALESAGRSLTRRVVAGAATEGKDMADPAALQKALADKPRVPALGSATTAAVGAQVRLAVPPVRLPGQAHPGVPGGRGRPGPRRLGHAGRRRAGDGGVAPRAPGPRRGGRARHRAGAAGSGADRGAAPRRPRDRAQPRRASSCSGSGGRSVPRCRSRPGSPRPIPRAWPAAAAEVDTSQPRRRLTGRCEPPRPAATVRRVRRQTTRATSSWAAPADGRAASSRSARSDQRSSAPASRTRTTSSSTEVAISVSRRSISPSV